MNINELVPSFEACKEAKELGFPQDESMLGYCDHPEYEEHNIMERRFRNSSEDFLDAPTLQEVIAELPGEILKNKALYLPFITKVKDRNGNVIYTTAYCSEWEALNDSYNFNNVNPVQAALELWIKLRKDGVI